MTYDTFVSKLLWALRPLLPSRVSPELSFSGSDENRKILIADAAIVSGSRALALWYFATLSEEITGVPANLYQPYPGPSRGTPLLEHSAYARNLRRWEAGTLPRKRKARADLVLVASCWLLNWGNGLPEVRGLKLANAHEEVADLVLGGEPLEAAKPSRAVAQLWEASTLAYQESLAQHRTSKP